MIKLSTKSNEELLQEIAQLKQQLNKGTIKDANNYTRRKIYTELIINEHEKKIINNINFKINSGETLANVLSYTSHQIKDLFKFQACNIYLYNDKNDYITLASNTISEKITQKIEKLTGFSLINFKIPLFKESGFTKLINEKKTISINNTAEALKDYSSKRSLQVLARTVSKFLKFNFGVRIPLISKGKVIGIMAVANSTKFIPEEVRSLESFAEQLALIINKVKNETELKSSQKKFEAIVESTPTPIMMSNLSDGKIIFANEATSNLLNLPLIKILGSKTMSYYADSSERKNLIDELNKKGVVTEKEIKINTGDDTYKWISISMQVINFNGVETIFSGITDITNRKLNDLKKIEAKNLALKIQKSLTELTKMKITGDFSYKNFLDKCLEITYSIFNNDRLSIWLPNDKGFYLSSYYGTKENPEGIDFLSNIEFPKYLKFMKDNRLLISNDVNKDNRLVELKNYFQVTESLSMLDSAAVLGGEIIAIICYERFKIYDWLTEEISFMRSISELIVSKHQCLTERNIQVKLEISEKTLNAFFNFAPVGITINNMDGRFIKVNVEFSRLTGYSIEELNNLSYWDLTPKKYLEEEETQLKDISERKAYGPYEKEYISKDGTLVPVLLKGIVMKSDSDGEDFIWSVVEDLTLSKNKEAEVISIGKELRQLIDTANAPIFGIDTEGNINEWNHTTAKISKYSKEEMMGTCLYEKLIPKENIEFIKTIMKESLLGKETSNYKFPIYTKDKKRVIMLLNANPRRDINGKITGVLSVGQDITELDGYREELEIKIEERTKKLNIALKKEKELNELKSKFISMTSHEFRTPLSTIKLAAGSIKKYWEKLDVYSRNNKLDKIEKQVRHMTYLLDDILTIGKSETGNIKTKFELLNFNELIRPIIEEVETFTNNTHKIILLNKNEDATILIDSKLANNIFNNLLNNAIKYSPNKKKIIVEVSSKNKMIQIKIIDFGIGIKKEEYKKVFQPFTRGENVDSIQGNGLGLSIVKNAIDLSGGEIKFESVVNKGTTFIINLKNAKQ